MIVKAVLDLVLVLLNAILLPVRIVTFPAAVASIILQIIGFLDTGAGIMKTFCHWNYISTLLGFIIAMNALVAAYHFGMWILKKIPFINIH